MAVCNLFLNTVIRKKKTDCNFKTTSNMIAVTILHIVFSIVLIAILFNLVYFLKKSTSTGTASSIPGHGGIVTAITSNSLLLSLLF